MKEARIAIEEIMRSMEVKFETCGIPSKDRVRPTFNFNYRNKFSDIHFIPSTGFKSMTGDELRNEVESSKAQKNKRDMSLVETQPLDKSHLELKMGMSSDNEDNDEGCDNEKEGTNEFSVNDKISDDAAETETDAGVEMIMPTLDDQEGIARYRNIFAVVADRSLVRDYGWGKCSVKNVDHSDFPILKDLLFESSTIQLMIDETRKRSKLLRLSKEEAERREAEMRTLYEEEERRIVERRILEEEERLEAERRREEEERCETERRKEEEERLDASRRKEAEERLQAERLEAIELAKRTLTEENEAKFRAAAKRALAKRLFFVIFFLANAALVIIYCPKTVDISKLFLHRLVFSDEPGTAFNSDILNGSLPLCITSEVYTHYQSLEDECNLLKAAQAQWKSTTEADVNQLKTQLQVMQEKNEELNSKYLKQRNTNLELKSSHEVTTALLQKQLEEAQEQHKELHITIKKLRDDYSTLKSSNNAKVDDLKQQLANALEQKAKLTTKYDKLKEANTEIKLSKKADVDNVTKELNEVKGQKESIKNKYNSLKSANANLQATIENKENCLLG